MQTCAVGPALGTDLLLNFIFELICADTQSAKTRVRIRLFVASN